LLDVSLESNLVNLLQVFNLYAFVNEK